MHTAYPILVTIPEQFDCRHDNNTANAGLQKLSEFLIHAVESQGYSATIAWGGMGKEVVLMIEKP